MIAGTVGDVEPKPLEDTEHVGRWRHRKRPVLKHDRKLVVLLFKGPVEFVPVHIVRQSVDVQ